MIKKSVLMTLLSLILMIIMIISVYANNSEITKNYAVEGIEEEMNALYLPNIFDEEMRENIRQNTLNQFNIGWSEWLQVTRSLGKEQYKTDAELYNEQWEYVNPKFKNGFLVSVLKTEKYIMQFIKNKKLSYLFSNTNYWSTNNNSWVYTKNGNLYIRKGDDGQGPRFVILDEGIEFLRDTNKLEEMLIKNNETKVSDVKLFSIDDGVQFLYILCGTNEYLIKIHDSHGGIGFDSIELFKLYSAEEVINNIILFNNTYVKEVICANKPLYNTEAEALQKEGLLQGNENGLDLLKPLTRIEATALLIRTLGLEDELSQYQTSAFSDIPSDNWGAPYAALAQAEGITNGVSDTKFAPNDNITADQFATFVLRASGETNIDYTKATHTLIDRGIITAEQTATMDLFTRGDMAKIIYEALKNDFL